jgi:hypothetical protein
MAGCEVSSDKKLLPDLLNIHGDFFFSRKIFHEEGCFFRREGFAVPLSLDWSMLKLIYRIMDIS